MLRSERLDRDEGVLLASSEDLLGVGGLHPKLKLDYYEELFRALKRRFPWIHIKALTMVELDFLASLGRTTVDEVIQRLREAGRHPVLRDTLYRPLESPSSPGDSASAPGS